MKPIYIRVTRPEGYEDVAPEIIIDDMRIAANWKPEDVTDEIERLSANSAEALVDWFKMCASKNDCMNILPRVIELHAFWAAKRRAKEK